MRKWRVGYPIACGSNGIFIYSILFLGETGKKRS
ncbi:hypothetical protein FHS11_000697 [Mucilaginibacter gotjawali]|uniref:Uncharacterized protein n=1 Tax=Mucilaginibacter gotjawali TaxID=1550579 RepID=A0A839SCI8_9SPHI|nr:hypothetical protein [Mucilaginibacter gotjawali]